MRRVAIVGTRPPNVVRQCCPREWAEYDTIIHDVQKFVRFLPVDTIVVSGGADGVDSFAVGAHRANMVELYTGRTRRELLARNQKIVDVSDEVHAWPSSWSRGTWDTIRKAQKAGKPYKVHEPWLVKP